MRVPANAEFSLKYKPVSLPTNTSKSKAKTLKRSTAYKTRYLTAGASHTNWFKFKQTRKRSLTVIVNAKGINYNGASTATGVKITCYCGGKKLGSASPIYYGQKMKFKVTNSSAYGKAKAGTYYFIITSMNKYTNGSYQIRVAK